MGRWDWLRPLGRRADRGRRIADPARSQHRHPVHGPDVQLHPSIWCRNSARSSNSASKAFTSKEPEFWARAGYSESFKREWQAFFGRPCSPPHSTAEAHFRSGQLKQHLLSRSLDRVTSVLRDVALRRAAVRFLRPDAQPPELHPWQIISPESRLRTAALDRRRHRAGVDRNLPYANVYAGKVAERTFETACLEYGIAPDLTRGTDRRMWFLHDPIEDTDRTWEDYLANYQRTLVCLAAAPWRLAVQVAPWPNRIFNRPYLREGSTELQPIPPDTATSYLIAMNSLRDLDQLRCAGPTRDRGSESRSRTPPCSSAGHPAARVDTTTASRTPWHSKAASSCTSPTSTVCATTAL